MSEEERLNPNFNINAAYESMIQTAKRIVNNYNQTHDGSCEAPSDICLAHDIANDLPILLQENAELKDKLSLINKMNENNYNRYCESLKENQKSQYQIEIMEKYLELIVDLGFDFDGCNTVESLKGLVEELVHLASLARACNLTETIYENGGKKYNILHEEIENNE